jgi:outer membrane receptor protein involved in Fe transport
MLTGYPLNRLLAHPGYANAGEIPVGGRGAFGRTPTQNIFDARAGYDWNVGEQKRLRLGADLFNIFNRTTTVDVDQRAELDGGVPNADFGQPLRVHRPFYARFSVRFEF